MAENNSHITATNASWSFDGIADIFDQHVENSVPLYHAGHDLVCNLSDFFLPQNATILEIGSSTGTLAKKLLLKHADRCDLTYVGIDSVRDMVDSANTLLKEDPRVSFEQEDIITREVQSASLIISYYTLQFIHPRSRQAVMQKIYDSLDWGGAFILFEKVRAPDARFQDIMTQIYCDFKLEKGFSEAEVINKSRSLKGVLEPFSTRGNIDLLKRAGFVDVMTVAKWVCFEGFLAIK